MKTHFLVDYRGSWIIMTATIMLTFITAFVLLFPGVFAYLSGRKFLAMEQTKEFALKYFKYQQRAALIFWVCLIISYMLFGFYDRTHIVTRFIERYTWGMGYLIYFLLAYSLFIIGFSLINGAVRKEQVPVFRRILFNILHLLLLMWPYVFLGFAAFGDHHEFMIRAIILLIVYGALYFFSSDFWEVFMQARPLDNTTLTNKFTAVTDQAGLASIPLHLFPAAGLKFANAFFVGYFGTKKNVYMSQFAYDNLSTEETMAIYAHEIGHAQDHQVIRRSLALVIPFLLLMVFGFFATDPHILIRILALVGALIMMRLLIPSQKFEKESDLFALKVINDAEIVIASLEKIYNLGILPERFSPSEEKRLSHPSLVKRKAYIREAAGQESPEIAEPVTFRGMEPGTGLTFTSDSLLISSSKGKTTTYKYHDVTSIFPKTQKDHIEVLIRLANAKQKLKIVAAYDDITGMIDKVSSKFSIRPYIDPGRFKRTYYIWSSITVFFGFIFSFIIGPALFALGIIGLIKRRKTMLLAIGLGNILFFLYPYIMQRHHYDAILQKEYSIVFGVIGLICLIDYLNIRRFQERNSGKDTVRFGFTIFFIFVQFCALCVILLNKLYWHATGLLTVYAILFFNTAVLSIGLLVSSNTGNLKKKTVLIICIFLLIAFVLLLR